MRKIREVLRLGHGLSLARVAESCGVGKGTVHDIALRAKACGLGWPLSEDLDDADLEQRLYRPPRPRLKRAQPDLERVHRELRRKGVTLELLWQEYHEQHPEDGYGYSRFCELYRQ